MILCDFYEIMFFGKDRPQSEGSRHAHPGIKSPPSAGTGLMSVSRRVAGETPFSARIQGYPGMAGIAANYTLSYAR